MNRKLSWVKEAFNRDVVIIQDEQIVGGMRRDMISSDVEAQLKTTHLRFDVRGFLVHSVTIHDLNAANQVVGQIDFAFGKRAELKLVSGESYRWKRHNMLMREWDMIRVDPYGLPEKEIVSYDLTRKFFQDAGDILINEENSPSTIDIVVLTGLFIRNYFQRRRRLATAAIVATR
ncbi:hypothetical protein G8759_03730 [Spirosoma aureum]|uniref:Uncharacterized protein n=1 Tax=Spirosoma aureum TaxID=2692134 RepID=A0A6G9AHK4_9BACT|nr:hypothetical protein [Spirosoma aureum]QIP11799.1 hypothetical protein G8759_03730 [Spirosoma aureum]